MIDKKKLQGMKQKVASDPNMTMDLKNDEIEELLKVYQQENNVENLNKLLNKVHVSRVLVPANVNAQKQPVPMVIKNTEGKSFLPIYTSKEQIPAEPKSPAILNIPFIAVNEMALRKEVGADGIVINPFSNNLIFKKELLEKVAIVEKSRQDAIKNGKKPITPDVLPKQITLTEAQYKSVERKQFEKKFLPDKFFSNNQEFMAELTDKREEYIDQLYEESYQQKRMYPYLPEDFAVMVMAISDTLKIARVDFQTRDMDLGCAIRAYIVLDTDRDIARYFTIDTGKEKTRSLVEMTADKKNIVHGDAPVEGAELQTILDMINDTTVA